MKVAGLLLLATLSSQAQNLVQLRADHWSTVTLDVGSNVLCRLVGYSSAATGSVRCLVPGSTNAITWVTGHWRETQPAAIGPLTVRVTNDITNHATVAVFELRPVNVTPTATVTVEVSTNLTTWEAVTRAQYFRANIEKPSP
jgi:hypothetical protein